MMSCVESDEFKPCSKDVAIFYSHFIKLNKFPSEEAVRGVRRCEISVPYFISGLANAWFCLRRQSPEHSIIRDCL